MSASASEQQIETKPADTNADTTAMELSLRQAAQKMDRGEEVQESEIHPLQPAKATGDKKPATEEGGRKTDAELASEKTAADKKAKDEQDAKDKEAAAKKADGEQKDDKTESAYAKAQKERERFDRNWKKFQEEQETFKQKQAQLEQRERALAERERTGGEQRRSAGPVKDKDGFTAADWDKAAAQWEKDGKYELADGAKEAAKGLREQEQRGGDQRQEQPRSDQPGRKPEDTPRTKEFEAKWNQNLVKLIGTDGFKELEKKDSPLFKATAEILNSDPRFSQFNDGIVFAAELARARLEASSASALRTTIQEQTKELEKLRKATSPGGGDTAETRGEAKSFEQLSTSEQEAALAKAAREADSG